LNEPVTAASKVPVVTLGFWIIKILATTLGETGGDTVTMTMNLGYLTGTIIFLSALIIFVVLQIRARRFHPFLYWATIIASTTAGTTMADFADRSLGIGYAGGSALLLACVLGLLGLWYRSQGTVSVNTVNTPKVEAFYWATITFSQTLGTALGDWTADDTGLGYLGAALLFSGALALIAIAYFRTRLSHVLLFWAAFILTRPLGATLGDFLDKPATEGGLALSRPLATAVLAVVILVCIIVIPQRAGQHVCGAQLLPFGLDTPAFIEALADIARRPAVPGANDNLSGVAVALEVAAAVAARPVAGLRLLFVSAGAEEALQQGVREFARAHFGALDPERTWFLTLDTVGSGRLVMLEGEGTVRMHDYGAPFKDLVADCARQAGVPLIRGLRSRNSTDGTVPHRHGFATVTLVSVDDRKMLPNYHLYSDTPENVDYRSVISAVRLTEAVARRLAGPR